MKVIKENNQWVLNEGLKLNSEYIFKFKKKYFIDTKHSTERYIERNTLTDEEVETLFKRIIQDFLNRGKSYTEKDGSYLFFSKSLNQGIVVNYRKDFKGIDKSRHFIIVTFLPRGKSLSTHSGDETIVVEKYEDSPYIENQEFVNYIFNLDHEQGEIPLNEDEKKNGNYKIKIKDFRNEDLELEFYFCEGKVWELISHELVEID